MLFRRKQSPAGPDRDPESTAPPPAATPPADAGLDAFADLLRLLGQHAFDVGEVPAREIQSAFEQWANHVLVGAPAPGATPEEEEPGATPNLRRAVTFAGDHRRRERDHVVGSLGDLRQALWGFVHALLGSVREEGDADTRAGQQLERLQAAVEAGSADAIRSEARDCVRVVGSWLEERRGRQEQQVEAMSERLSAVRSELASAHEEMARDSLTGLFSRAAFDEQLGRLVDLGSLLSQPAYLFMIDIDDFKWVNDHFGHPCGDEVLRQAGQALIRSFYRTDDFPARYGGDEFAVLIEDVSVENARTIGERVLFAIRDAQVMHEGEEARVTASIGIARLTPGEAAERWLARADAALYQAKESGRDRLVVDVSNIQRREPAGDGEEPEPGVAGDPHQG